MKLFYTQRSPYARKVRILAIEKGLDLEYREEDLTKKSTALLNYNPIGKIPVLVIDEQTSLCDSPLICEYLDQLKPEPRFIPSDPAQRRAVLNAAAIADGLMDITVGAYMEKVRHPLDFHQKFIETQYTAIERLMTFFESQVSELKPWHLGSVGVACAIGYLQFRLPLFFVAEKYPQLSRWYQDVSSRPSLKDTLPG